MHSIVLSIYSLALVVVDNESSNQEWFSKSESESWKDFCKGRLSLLYKRTGVGDAEYESPWCSRRNFTTDPLWHSSLLPLVDSKSIWFQKWIVCPFLFWIWKYLKKLNAEMSQSGTGPFWRLCANGNIEAVRQPQQKQKATNTKMTTTTTMIRTAI